MKSTVVIAVVVVVVIVVVAGIALFVISSKLSSTGTPSTSVAVGTVASVQIINNSLSVGYQSGLWEIGLKNTGNTGVSMITIYLKTPTPSEVCSASSNSAGLSFSLCPSVPGNPLPPGTTIFGVASGIGEGSATIGSSYPVDAKVTYASGTIGWVNETVTAQQPSG